MTERGEHHTMTNIEVKVRVILIKDGFNNDEENSVKRIVESVIGKKEEMKVVALETIKINNNSSSTQNNSLQLNDSDIVIVKYDLIYQTQSNLQQEKIKKHRNLIYLINNKFTNGIMKNAENDSVLGIFNVGEFYGDGISIDYQEISRFAETLKKAIRNELTRMQPEELICKKIDWKLSLGKDYGAEISLFSDPKIRSSIIKVNRICDGLKSIVEELKKIRDGLEKDIQSLQPKKQTTNQELNNNVVEIIEKINSEFKSESIPRRVPLILIRGSSGSGKTLMAKYISERLGYNDFTRITLLNIPQEKFEEELFGMFSSDGSFIPGKLLMNIGKAVFFDEIGDIVPTVQAKLLTYFDDMEAMIENYHNPVKIPLFIIGATNRDIESDVKKGDFRADLFHRFDYEIRIPALKERMSDFRYILSFVLQNEKNKLSSKVEYISIRAIEKLENYDYPGNFRELEIIVRNAVVNAEMNYRTCIIERDIEF